MRKSNFHFTFFLAILILLHLMFFFFLVLDFIGGSIHDTAPRIGLMISNISVCTLYICAQYYTAYRLNVCFKKKLLFHISFFIIEFLPFLWSITQLICDPNSYFDLFVSRRRICHVVVFILGITRIVAITGMCQGDGSHDNL